jgi:hypothetical protein
VRTAAGVFAEATVLASQLLHFFSEDMALRAYRNTMRLATLTRKRDHNISSIA